MELKAFCVVLVLVLSDIDQSDAGYLHDVDDTDTDFYTLLSSGSNTPIYSVYSKHLSQPHFFDPPSTTPVPKPRVVPLSTYPSSKGNHWVQYVYLQSPHLVELPSVPDSENKPRKSNKKNNKSKPKEQDEEKKEDPEDESVQPDDDDVEAITTEDSSSENTTPVSSSSSRLRNSPNKSNGRGNTGTPRSQNKNKQNLPLRSRKNKSIRRPPSNKMQLNTNTRQNKTSSPSETVSNNSTKIEKSASLRNAAAEANEFSVDSMAFDIIRANQINSVELSSPASRTVNNDQQNSPSPSENNINDIPTREGIDEAIKILSRVAAQISRLQENSNLNGAQLDSQRQPPFENQNSDNEFNNSNNGGERQFPTPEYNAFSGNGNGNTYGDSAQRSFSNTNQFQEQQRELPNTDSQAIRNGNQNAYGSPSVLREIESRSKSETPNSRVEQSESIRNIRSQSNVQSPIFEIIRALGDSPWALAV